MRVVGIRRDGGSVKVADLSADGRSLRVLASLPDFWADPLGYVAAETAGQTLLVQDLEFVPPVLPQAR